MKRSEYRGKRVVHHEQAMGYYCRCAAARKRADLDVEAAEAAGVAWDPEEPEGFDEWYANATLTPGMREKCLAAWNACLAHQEAQGRTISPEVDPEVRRKEIEAQIEAWAFASDRWYGEEYQPSKVGWVRRGRDLAQRLGVL